MKFPKHDCSLTLQHNAHKDYYQSAADWLEEQGEVYDWKNEEAKQRAIETDNIWTLNWYPNTPIGSHSIAAPTLEELLAFANEE